jgi:hypothetical protein
MASNKLNSHPLNPFRYGDRVISSDRAVENGLHGGRPVKGTVSSRARKAEAVHVRVDGKPKSSRYAVSFWTLLEGE